MIFLYETWTSSKNNVKLSGYTAHNFYRQFQHRNARRCSGGLMLYYWGSLKDGISIVKNQYDTIIWVKLDAVFFKLDTDVYICGTYLWGETSPVYNIVNVELFDALETDVTYFQTYGSVYVMGDLNSRVGLRNDCIIHGENKSFTDDAVYVPDTPLLRASSDSLCNRFGIKLFDKQHQNNDHQHEPQQPQTTPIQPPPPRTTTTTNNSSTTRIT